MNTEITMQVTGIVREATNVSLSYIETEARLVMRRCPTIHEFIMAMGWATFKSTDGGAIEDDDPRIASVIDFISEWDETLRLTGVPMRFTAKGEKVTDW